MGELGVIGKMAIVSLKRKATDAAASLPSTVILLLLDVSHLSFQFQMPELNRLAIGNWKSAISQIASSCMRH
jgi:hypothetical protein